MGMAWDMIRSWTDSHHVHVSLLLFEWFTYVAPVAGVLRGCDTLVYSASIPVSADAPAAGRGGAAIQPKSGDEGTVCYQAIVGSLTGSYADINASFSTWAQGAYQALNLSGPSDVSINWARVPDRNSFENGCHGPYATVADFFVHINTNNLADDYVTVSQKLETYIAAHPWNATSAISCSARSVTDFIPICGINGGSTGSPNTQCPLATFDYRVTNNTITLDNIQANGTVNYVDVHITHGAQSFNYRMNGKNGSYSYPIPLQYIDVNTSRLIS